MKFCHLIRLTRSRYFTVDYDVYRILGCTVTQLKKKSKTIQ